MGSSETKAPMLAPSKLVFFHTFRYQVLQYLAEAYCMLGHHQQSIECLKDCTGFDSPEARFKVDNLATDLRETSPVQGRIVNLVNMSAVYMCSGQLEQAKQTID